MKRPRRRQPVVVALYLNAGLLGAVLVALLARGGGFGLTSPAHANPLPNPPAIGVVGNLALMPAQFSSNIWGCYVLDADKRTLCAYQYLLGQNLFDRPVPTSLLQLWVPRVELHLFYNTIVFIPMVVAMYFHMFPPAEAGRVTCTCAWHRRLSPAV